MHRKAQARWQGSAQEGSGTLSVQSGTLQDTPYTFKVRFGGEGGGTNPEELIAAAHAGCFSMALAFGLGNAGYSPQAIETEAQLTFDKVKDAWTITAIHLTTRARVANIDQAKFGEIANGAKANCPVSRVLNASISLDAQLAS